MSETPVVLIVDDAPENLQALAECLKTGYRIKVAKSGQRCLELAEKDPRPDLILLDVSMPDMDGYEVIKLLKENPSLESIPVIFVTGRDSVNDEEKGLTLGAVDYVTKPYSPIVVRARVNTHIELKQQRDQLKRLAMYDQLTGLYNRHFLIESAKQKVAHSRRHGVSLSLIILDIDHFKQVNDQYGHNEGDLVLKHVAQTIQSVFREDDLLGVGGADGKQKASPEGSGSEAQRSGVVARYGGEEFVVLLSHCRLNDAYNKADSLRAQVENLMPQGRRTTISCGVAELTEGESFDEFVNRADAALYSAKNNGRNQTVKAD